MPSTATAATKPGTLRTLIGASVWLLACSSSALQKPKADAATGSGGTPASGGTSGQGGFVDGGAPGGSGGAAGGRGDAPTAGSGGMSIPTGGTAGATAVGPTTGGAAGSANDGAAGGAGGGPPDAGPDAVAQPDTPVDRVDAPAPPTDAAPILDGGWGEVGAALAEFCVGSQSKVLYAGKTYEAPATSKWTDPFLDCCQVYAARVHTAEALGKDFEVAVRIQVGMDDPGVVPVGPAGGRVSASLRTNPASHDGGFSADPTVAGSIYVGGKPFGSSAWTLGACVSVDDPASPLAGTRVYVPGVPVAPSAWSSRLRFLALEDESTIITSVTGKDLQTLALATQPLLDLMDIDFVDSDTKACGTRGEAACGWVGINTVLFSGTILAGKVTNTAPGMPFVVEADGERIYLGVVQSINSAWAASVARIAFEDIRADGFPVYPPPSWTGAQPDLRNDPRIVKVLTEAGKLIP